MTIKELKELAVMAAKGSAPANFTAESVDKALCDGLNELAGSYNEFQRNKYDIFDIIIEAADEVVPNKVIDAMGAFAEVKQVPQGQKVMFTVKKGRNRARKFITQAALSGVYRMGRLDSDTFTVNTFAIGGGMTLDFERMLDGVEVMSDYMEVITEGLTDAIFGEVQKALKASINAAGRPAANVVSLNTFSAADMLKLCNTVKAYGDGAVIMAAPEFIAAMGPDAIVPVTAAGAQGIYHPQDIDAIHNNGYINIFRGNTVVSLPQSFVDEKNEKTWIDPQFAYVFPTGREKVVKVVLEGATQIRSYENRDNSMELNAYKKVGVAIVSYHNWGVYQNTGIPSTVE